MIKYKNNIETRCSFCQVHTETVYHLFWTCSYTEHLWKDMETFIKNNIQQDISVTFKDIIFGHFDSDSNNNKSCFVINLIYFLGKFYIHKCKFTNNKPIFFVFLKEFKIYLNTISSSVNKKARKQPQFVMTLICILYLKYKSISYPHVLFSFLFF